MGSTRFAKRAGGLLVPTPRFFQGNCPCCGIPPDCDIISTDFNMADGTTLPTGWPTTTGWEISSNKLKGPSSGVPIFSSVSAPTPYMTVSVDVSSVSSTSAFLYAANARLRLLNTGSNSILILDRDVSGTYVEVDRYTPSPSTNITSGTMTLCTNSDGTVCGKFGSMHAGDTFSSITGTSFGLATFSTSVRFDNFVAKVVSSNCQPCVDCANAPLKCGNCDVIYYNLASATLDFTGTAASGCCSVDGVWSAIPANVSPCSGRADIPHPSPCAYSGFYILWSVNAVTISGSPGTKFLVELKSNGPGDWDATQMSWSYSFLPADENCSGAKTLTLDASPHQGTGCTGSIAGSTVTMEVNLT